MNECPRCGIETDGAWSEGGLKWAICEACMNHEPSRGEWIERKMMMNCLKCGRKIEKQDFSIEVWDDAIEVRFICACGHSSTLSFTAEDLED